MRQSKSDKNRPESTTPPTLTKDEIAAFSSDLLAWYRVSGRSLPWRDRKDDPYAVWISEIMLQQTTVNAVVSFYNRWMLRFPTVTSLADATLDDVLKHWAGLGYYARARNLKKAAEQVSSHFEGRLPQSVEELMRLPGIGRYTAGAISSIAFGCDSPTVDANIIRVICRLFALHGDPKSSSTLTKRIWEIAELLLPSGHAGEFNQSLMELGALICLPASPRCESCPVSTYCKARTTGDPAQFPEFGEAKNWIDVAHAACFVQHDGRLLIVQRPLEQLWGGLWELPRTSAFTDEDLGQTAVRAVRETVGILVTEPAAAGFVKHVVTNRKVSLYGFDAEWDGAGDPAPIACRQLAWVKPDELDKFAISSPQLELLAQWREAKKHPTLKV
jgi:A/G-specific adenine glycosylase